MSNISRAMIRWKEIIIITVLIRLLLLIIPSFSLQSQNLSDTWNQWDAPHYIDLAKNWYQTSGDPANFIVFYPLYPILIKTVSLFINNFVLSALIISSFLSITAAILLYELVLLDFNKRTAFLSVWFMNIFPTSYFLQAPYTESLFLTTSLATIFFYRKRYFLQSGLAGVFASLTRVNGILLLPTLIMETKSLGKNLISLFLTPLGFLLYLFINFQIFGNPFHFSKVLSSNWYKQLTFPWISIENLIHFYQSQTGSYYWLFFAELITILLLFVFTIIVFIKIRKSYGIYMFVNLLLFTSTAFIMSTPRYALVLFPVFIALALIKNKLIQAIISLIFLILLFYLTYLYTQGKWAY